MRRLPVLHFEFHLLLIFSLISSAITPSCISASRSSLSIERFFLQLSSPPSAEGFNIGGRVGYNRKNTLLVQ
ncbi:hypothetical protein K1719_027457 [Acacia pycnantha]|nr:hypothetical protein K1719_027457 [Acacia pycnantha]